MNKKYLLILACGFVLGGCTTEKNYITNNPVPEPDTVVKVDTVKVPHDQGNHFGQDSLKDKGKP